MRIAVNLTGRVDLPRENVAAQVSSDGGIQKMSIEWDFSMFNLSKNCEVKLDLWASGTYETRRIMLGELSSGAGKAEDIDVSEMRNSERLKCRFVVTSLQNGIPMIVAQLDQISVTRLGNEDDETSILQIVADPLLASLWELQIIDGEPVLRIKDKRGLCAYLKSEAPLFDPLVMPEVLGKVFDWFVKPDDQKNTESFEEWKAVFIDLGCESEVINMAEVDSTDIDADVLLKTRRDIQANFVARHRFFDLVEAQMDNVRGAE